MIIDRDRDKLSGIASMRRGEGVCPIFTETPSFDAT
jgi:hypothetical protein